MPPKETSRVVSLRLDICDLATIHAYLTANGQQPPTLTTIARRAVQDFADMIRTQHTKGVLTMEQAHEYLVNNGLTPQPGVGKQGNKQYLNTMELEQRQTGEVDADLELAAETFRKQAADGD